MGHWFSPPPHESWRLNSLGSLSLEGGDLTLSCFDLYLFLTRAKFSQQNFKHQIGLWSCIPVIPALGKDKQEAQEFKTVFGYRESEVSGAT